MSIATLLPDGKVELPEEIRYFLHLQVGSQLSFTIAQDQVVVQVVRLPVQSLKGMLKRPDVKAVSIEEMNEAIIQGASVGSLPLSSGQTRRSAPTKYHVCRGEPTCSPSHSKA